MYIKKISVSGFRNIDRAEIAADGEMNILYGENAQGKTNILEAIWLFTGAKSFRGGTDFQTVMKGREQANLEEEFFACGREQQAKLKITNRREFELNGVTLKTPGEMAATARAVVFSPQDIELISGGPEGRRKTIDLGIGFIYPAYIEKLRRYYRTLKQRNAILREMKNGGVLSECLPEYDGILCETGADIIKMRKAYTELVKEKIPEIYGGLSGGRETITVEYITTGSPDAGEYRKKTEKNMENDIKYATTGAGPHRDDLAVKINGNSARIYASQGQRRSAALTLKLAQAEITKEKTGEKPVALLDDVLSELDGMHQNYILNHINSWQVFITCCEPEFISKRIKGKKFAVKNGCVSGE